MCFTIHVSCDQCYTSSNLVLSISNDLCRKNLLKNSYLIDTDFVFEVINKDEFVSFNNEVTTDDFLDAENRQKIKVTDEEAQKIIEKYSKCKSIVEFQALDKRVRDKSLKIFKEKGLSIRQISRLTGTSYYLVQKA